MKRFQSNYKGKHFVLIGHTANEFVERCEDFKKLDTELLGLSIDSIYPRIK